MNRRCKKSPRFKFFQIARFINIGIKC